MSFFKSLFGKNKNSSSDRREEDAQAAPIAQETNDKRSERDADTLKFDALRAMKMGNIPFALKALEKSLELREEFETRYYYAEALTAAQREEDALKQYDQLLAEYPEHVPTLLFRSKLRLDLGRAKEAIEDITTALRYAEEEATFTALYTLGARGYLSLGEFEKALEMAQKALDADEKSVRPYLLKSQALIGLERLEEAEAFVQKAIESFEEEEQFHLIQANIAELRGDSTAQMKAFTATLDKDPFNMEAYMGIAILKNREGDRRGAIALMEETREQNNVTIKFLSLLAQLYHEEGLEEKEQTLRKKIEEQQQEMSDTTVRFDNLYEGGIF